MSTQTSPGADIQMDGFAPVQESIAVVGLGYVGLPVALGLGRHFDDVIGFDIDARKVEELQNGVDRTQELGAGDFEGSSIRFTADAADLEGATFFVVAVPTPIDENRTPDLSALVAASRTIGEVISPGGVVVVESTVYPGVTEEICGPVIAETSGLEQGRDFKLGYSPERINPGDKEHTLETVVKVVSGEDDETLERVAAVYGEVVEAGVYRAPSIRVAEAAKVIENVQRDLNIALMNELAVIFDRLDLRTRDVLDAANTKWNFLPFHPGLVGGHCIGVDPYYLTTKAEAVDYHPQVILAGRRINDSMGAFVAQKTVKLLTQQGISLQEARVGILGLTFKENVGDVRNSRVPEIAEEFAQYRITPLIHDPLADPDTVHRVMELQMNDLSAFKNLDALILAVPHDLYLNNGQDILSRVRTGGVFVDVKSVIDPEHVGDSIEYWSL